MIALIAAAVMLAADVPPTTPADEDARRAYDAARGAAGRSPGEQVRLALWCEAHGLDAERARHLAQAVLADPAHAAARGLLGLVASGERWLRPEAVAERAKADAALAEYQARRAATPYSADAQWALALWAEGKGLGSQARAHFIAVTRLDPRRELAWKKLGYRRAGGRWATDAELAAERADGEAQREADKRWRPLLEKWKAQRGRAATRAEAGAGLLGVTDPRAVPSIVATFLAGADPDPAAAVRLLGQVDSGAASRALAIVAATADDPEVRREAIETLRHRDPREFAALLIRPLADRLEYEVRPVAGPGSAGQLVIKGRKQNVIRTYATPGIPPYLQWLWQTTGGTGSLEYGFVSNRFDGTLASTTQSMSFNQFLNYRPTDPDQVDAVRQAQGTAERNLQQFIGKWENYNNRAYASAHPKDYRDKIYGMSITKSLNQYTPVRTQVEFPLAALMAEYLKSAAAARMQVTMDAATVEQYNREVDQVNERMTAVLRPVSGKDLGADRDRWTRWLVDLSGYALIEGSPAPVPTFAVDVPPAYLPQPVPFGQAAGGVGPSFTVTQTTVGGGSSIVSCFGAGTPVRTIAGPRPIETLRAGDVVLAQDVATGGLRIQPIVGVHHNPPSPTFVIRVGGDDIVSSPFHRFWKVGQGWVMARDVHTGDRLRLLGGSAVVEEFRPGTVQPVFNLDVAGDADFFAGASAALVHDNTLPDPRLVPFDLPAEPAAKAEPVAGP